MAFPFVIDLDALYIISYYYYHHNIISHDTTLTVTKKFGNVLS